MGLSFWVDGFAGVPLNKLSVPQPTPDPRLLCTYLTGPSPVWVVAMTILAVFDSLLRTDERRLQKVLV